MRNKWLVTGGAGFVGSHLVDRLLALGQSVTVLDNFSTGSRRNLPTEVPGLTVLTGDVCSSSDVSRAMKGVSGVYHCAATVAVQSCIENWISAHQANATATIRLFDVARQNGGIPVVYASSAAVYGDCSDTVCHEDMSERPISPYGADKLTCEHQARAFMQVHGLPSAGLRFFNVYGPRQNASSPYSGVLARFCNDRLQDRAPVIYGDGLQSRDFIHVRDVISALVSAMDVLTQTGETFVSNVCTGRSVSLIELLGVIDACAGEGQAAANFLPQRQGDIRHSRGHTGRMTELLGSLNPLPLELGVMDYWNWLQADPASSDAAWRYQPLESDGYDQTANIALPGYAQLGL